MSKDYIEIKQFAEIAGVSVQSIYKRLKKQNNPLQPYFKEVDGKKFLRRSALLNVYGIEDPVVPLQRAIEEDQRPHEAEPEKKESPASEPKEKKDPTERLLDLLEQQLKEKDLQLQEKDKQIKEKDEQIKTILSELQAITKVADQQQQLTAMDKGLLPKAKKDPEDPEVNAASFGSVDPEDPEVNAAAVAEIDPEDPERSAAEPKKKGLFSWLRG